MKAMKILGGLLAFTLLLFLLVANFSVVESRFECNGKITADGAEQPATVFVKLEKYRWWVGLWSDSSGSAWVEIPNQTISYFGHVTEAGDQLQLWDSFGSPSNISGIFSTLSRTLGVKAGALGVFEGACKDIRQ
jgi:hypothetical protein